MRLETVVLLLGVALVTGGCEPSIGARSCSTEVSLRDEISNELSEIETAKSELDNAASELEEMIDGIRARSNLALEEVQSVLETVARKLDEVHQELESREITAECEVE